jgi:hypothetical protein
MGDLMNTKTRNISKAVLDTKEAAEFLGIVSRRTLERWRLSSIPKGPRWVKIEGKIGYRLRDLEEYLDQATKTPGDDFAA